MVTLLLASIWLTAAGKFFVLMITLLGYVRTLGSRSLTVKLIFGFEISQQFNRDGNKSSYNVHVLHVVLQILLIFPSKTMIGLRI